MRKLWFKAKRYGYGWYPASWEGWAVMIGYIALLSWPQTAIWIVGPNFVTDELFITLYLPYGLVLTIVLLLICKRTGEKARWRWGK